MRGEVVIPSTQTIDFPVQATRWNGTELCPIAPAILLLLWPAFYNGFPLVFPDTGAYFSVAWGHYWTVDRSGFYGFFLRPLSLLDPQVQVWTGVTIQAAAVTAVMLLTIRKMAPEPSPAVTILLVAAMAAATSLPWHSAQLMPDAFSGVCVLAVWLACMKNPTDSGAPMLWFGAYVAGLLHYTHVVLIVATGTATLLAQLFFDTANRMPVAKRAVACAVVATAILATQTVANGLFLKCWSTAPIGPAFLFARLHEDGLVQPWLKVHCPEGATPLLCRSQPQFARDSQTLLWNDNSQFTRLAARSRLDSSDQSFLAELRTASLGSIGERPLLFGANSLRAGLSQFLHFRVLDDECPQVCRSKSSAVYGWFRDYRPALLPSFLSSRQLEGNIPKPLFRWITTPITVVSILLIPVLLWSAWRRRDPLVSSLLAAVLFALLSNALVTGALSDVHDRYQSRLVWLAPFSVLFAILRWRTARAVEPADSQTRIAAALTPSTSPAAQQRPTSTQQNDATIAAARPSTQ